MEKFTGKTYEEYKEYAKLRRSKSQIVRAYEDALKEYKVKSNIEVIDIPPLLNGAIRSDSTYNPYSYMCQLTQGAVNSDVFYAYLLKSLKTQNTRSYQYLLNTLLKIQPPYYKC